VFHKTSADYIDIFARHATGADQGLMAGNSMASDVLPMFNAGGWGVFVPHGLTWAIEDAVAPTDHPRFSQINNLSALPALIADITTRKLTP
jgi:putative hydrolase of the HAD superfamily